MMGFSFTTFERVSSRREKKGKEGGKDKEKSAQEKKKNARCVYSLHVCDILYRYNQ